MSRKDIETAEQKLNPGIEAVQKLRYMGYQFTISGNTIEISYAGQEKADPGQIQPLLDLVREHKKEVLHFLKGDCPVYGGVGSFWGSLMSREERKIANRKLRQRVEAWRRGPYRERFEKLYREYLTRTYGPREVEKHWYDILTVISSKNPFHALLETTWGDFARTPEALELTKEFNLIRPWPTDIYWPDGIIFRDKRAVEFIGAGPGEVKDGEDRFLKRGRYIEISIDLYKPKKQIMAEINQLIEFILDYAEDKLPKKKVRGCTIDSLPFVVYDMHHRDGKSLLQITHYLFPDTKGEDPNIDSETKKCYERVRRAYQKAKRLIPAV
jgi:hypothetical protein